jgi:hypothetical protein
VKARKPKAEPLGPLQLQAEDLLARLRRVNATRGDVAAVLQSAIIEALREVSREMCDRGCEFPCPPQHECGAERLWAAWKRARPRLWGRLA